MQLHRNTACVGESFYCFTAKLECKRLSDTEDILPVTISERLIITENISVGSIVEVQGQLRSYNNYVDGKTHLMLTVFVKDIVAREDGFCGNPNEIKLTGFICKEPVYRKTPFGREISFYITACCRPPSFQRFATKKAVICTSAHNSSS